MCHHDRDFNPDDVYHTDHIADDFTDDHDHSDYVPVIHRYLVGDIVSEYHCDLESEYHKNFERDHVWHVYSEHHGHVISNDHNNWDHDSYEFGYRHTNHVADDHHYGDHVRDFKPDV